MRTQFAGLAAACFAAAALSGPALAQTHAAAPAAPQALNYGPAIPGICVINNDYVVGASAVGKYVQQRLQQLSGQAGAELNAERDSLRSDATALESQKASLAAADYNKRATALNARLQELQQHAQRTEAEMQRTQQKAVARVLDEARPILLQTFTQHSCSLLINGDAVMAAAPSMDLTPIVISGLDAKIKDFPFEREHTDPNAQAAPAR